MFPCRNLSETRCTWIEGYLVFSDYASGEKLCRKTLHDLKGLPGGKESTGVELVVFFYVKKRELIQQTVELKYT